MRSLSKSCQTTASPTGLIARAARTAQSVGRTGRRRRTSTRERAKVLIALMADAPPRSAAKPRATAASAVFGVILAMTESDGRHDSRVIASTSAGS